MYIKGNYVVALLYTVYPNSNSLNKPLLQLMTSNYNKAQFNMPQNFDLQLLWFKVFLKWLQFSGTSN